MILKSRPIAQVIPATVTNPMLNRLIGTVDIDGKGTLHPLADVNPFMLLDQGILPKHNMPPFGAHPHRGHSVVTLIFRGREQSWDSMTKEKTIVQGPASYWVDAGNGVFHDEVSIIEDESDQGQHVGLFQLWISVSERDRTKPARVQYQENLPIEDALDKDGTVVGTIRYYVGPGTGIETPHPIVVAHVAQKANTQFQFPIEKISYGGFLVNLNGSKMLESTGPPDAPTMFGSDTTCANTNDVLVLANNDKYANCVEVTTGDATADYLICVGERIEEPWFKKLVANGAVIAASSEEARQIAERVERYAAAGKQEAGTFQNGF